MGYSGRSCHSSACCWPVLGISKVWETIKMSRNVMIKTKELTKKYEDLTAVDNLNLEIYEGEIFGLLES